ncbi:hypothetical protein [Plantactinospora sp. GCM10030261]|uniref:maleate cis-trans isomerase family protein n=1 Tax=Plantactinospora sp. GCM10030261 TaxID=3273420 RepID=UPI00361083C5
MNDEWSHRLGFLVPSANSVLEWDSRLALPPPVSAHFARIAMTRDEPDQLVALAEAAPGTAELLRHAGCTAVGFACTTGSLYRGLGYDAAISARVTEATGLPCATTATAAVDALRSLGLARVLLVSPYEPWLDALVVDFLAAHGIEVTGTLGPSLPDPRDTARATPAQIAGTVTDLGPADGIFVSCTAFRGLEAATLLRQRFGCPVVASNEATFWGVARLVGAGPADFPHDGWEGLRRWTAPA